MLGWHTTVTQGMRTCFELMSKSYTIISLHLAQVTTFTFWFWCLMATSGVRFLYWESCELMLIYGQVLLLILIIPTPLM